MTESTPSNIDNKPKFIPADLDFILNNQIDLQLNQNYNSLKLNFPISLLLDLLIPHERYRLAFLYIMEVKAKTYNNDTTIELFKNMCWRNKIIEFPSFDLTVLDRARNNPRNADLFPDVPLGGLTARYGSLPNSNVVINAIYNYNGYFIMTSYDGKPSSHFISSLVQMSDESLSRYGYSYTIHSVEMTASLLRWVEVLYHSLTLRKVPEIKLDHNNYSPFSDIVAKLRKSIYETSPPNIKPIVEMALDNVVGHGNLLLNYQKLMNVITQAADREKFHELLLEHVPEIIERITLGSPLHDELSKLAKRKKAR